MSVRAYTDLFNAKTRLPDGMPTTPTGAHTGTAKRIRELATNFMFDLLGYLTDPPTLMQVDVIRETTADGATAYTLILKLPVACRVVAVDHGCLAAAGASATAMLQYSTDDGSTWTDMQAAATDVKTGAGTPTRVAPNDTKTEFESGDWLRVKLVNGAGGALTGYLGKVWLKLI